MTTSRNLINSNFWQVANVDANGSVIGIESGSYASGNSNIAIDANANVTISSNGVANVATVSAETITVNYTSTAGALAAATVISLDTVAGLTVGEVLIGATFLAPGTTITAITGLDVTVSAGLLINAPLGTVFSTSTPQSLVEIAGNLTVAGVSDLGPVGNVFISGGTDKQFLQTDGAGNLVFATVDSFQIANGNSNVVVAANANVTISSNGVANVATLSAAIITTVYTSTADAAIGDFVLDLDTVAGLLVGDILIQATALSPSTFVTDITSLQVTVDQPLIAAALTGTIFTTVEDTSLVELTGNLTVAGVTSLGNVGNVVITGGSDGQALFTDGTGNLNWVTISADKIVNGNSNVIVYANAAVTVSSNGQSNVLVVNSNGTHAQSTFTNDVTITGNLNVQGNATYINTTSQAITDPVFDIGVGANNTPLTTDDTLDRGMAMHSYGAGAQYVTAGATPLGNTFIAIANTVGIVVGMEIGDPTNGNLLTRGTQVVAVSANSNIAISSATLGIIPTATALGIGQDIIRFVGWDTGNAEIVLASNVTIANNVVVVNELGNTRVGNLIIVGNIVANADGANSSMTFGTDGNNANIAMRTANSNSSVRLITANANSNIALATEAVNSKILVSTAGNTANVQISTAGLDSHLSLATTGNSANIISSTTGLSSRITTSTTGNTANIATSTTGVESQITLGTLGNAANITATTTGVNANITLGTLGNLANISVTTAGANTRIILGTTGNRSNILGTTTGVGANIAFSTINTDANIELKTDGNTANISATTAGVNANIILGTAGNTSNIDATTTGTNSNIKLSTTGANAVIRSVTTGVNSYVLTTTTGANANIGLNTTGNAANIAAQTSGANANILIGTTGNTARVVVSTSQDVSPVVVSTAGVNAHVLLQTTGNVANISATTTGVNANITFGTTGNGANIYSSTQGTNSNITLASSGNGAVIAAVTAGANANIALNTTGNAGNIIVSTTGVNSSMSLSTAGNSSPISITTNGNASTISIKSTGVTNALANLSSTVYIDAVGTNAAITLSAGNSTANSNTVVITANTLTMSANSKIQYANVSNVATANSSNVYYPLVLDAQGVISKQPVVNSLSPVLENTLFVSPSGPAIGDAYLVAVVTGSLDSANAATTSTLAISSAGTVTYNNGTAGVGATLTTTGAYTGIDNVTLTVGMTVLVKNEVTAANNGVYTVTSTTVLTRVTNFDTSAEMLANSSILVLAGTTNINTRWAISATVTTVGTTAVTWIVSPRVLASASVATTQDLATTTGGTITYNNGTAGVGATLTTSTTFTNIDAIALTVGMRVLVKDEVAAANNGVYNVTSATVLTRATSFDASVEMLANTGILVTAGTVNIGKGWSISATVTTVGTTAVTWVSNDWVGQSNNIATWTGAAWSFYTPSVNDITTILTGTNAGNAYKWDGTAWTLQTVNTGLPIYNWTLAASYRAGDLVIYNNNEYQANGAIPANTAFVVATTGATWKLIGGYGSLAEFGELVPGLNIGIPVSNVTPQTASVMTWEIPSAGVWEVSYSVRVETTGNQSYAYADIVPFNTTTPLANSAAICGFFNVGGATSLIYQGTAVQTVRITTAGAAFYTLRITSNGASQVTQVIGTPGGTNGISKVVWKKISGLIPTNGAVTSYGSYRVAARTTTGVYNLTLQSGSLSVTSSTLVTLKAGTTYQLSAFIGVRATFADYNWETSAGVIIGTKGISLASNSVDTASPTNAYAIYTPTADTNVRLILNGLSGYITTEVDRGEVSITQLGTTNTAGFTGALGNAWSLANSYQSGTIVVKDAFLYQANAFIAAGTAFVTGTTGATWLALGSNQLAENGQTVLSNNVNLPVGGTYYDVLSFTLPSAGVWEVEYVNRSSGSAANADFTYLIADSSNVAVANSEVYCFVASGAQGSVTGVTRITTTGAATYKLRARSNTANCNVITDASGRTQVVWNKISGFLALTANPANQLPVYANTGARDAAIPSPTPGLQVFVTGTGMQVRGATAWNTIAGTAT